MQESGKQAIKREMSKEPEPSRQLTILQSQSCNYLTDETLHLLYSSELKLRGRN